MYRLLIVTVCILVLPACGVSTSSTGAPAFFPPVPRIVAIGDLHGDLEAARDALNLAGAIDDADHWIGGELVLIQLGDILDRGDDEQAILDLFHTLSEEAERSGGAVHQLHGNHELMNVDLDLRYVTPGGFEDFQDAVEYDFDDPDLIQYETSQRARVAAFRAGGKYAKRLAGHNVVTVIGENIFVHGGLLPQHLDYGIERLNSEVSDWLRGTGDKPGSILKSGSPVWTRRYSVDVGEDDCATLDTVLTTLSAKRIIVGHSVQDNGIESYCDGRIWCIDTGMAAHYGGERQVLEIIGDSLRILR